jgi:hypothetical protein
MVLPDTSVVAKQHVEFLQPPLHSLLHPLLATTDVTVVIDSGLMREKR